jgi:hypothetical protein
VQELRGEQWVAIMNQVVLAVQDSVHGMVTFLPIWIIHSPFAADGTN